MKGGDIEGVPIGKEVYVLGSERSYEAKVKGLLSHIRMCKIMYEDAVREGRPILANILELEIRDCYEELGQLDGEEMEQE